MKDDGDAKGHSEPPELRRLRMMLLIRTFEERLARLYTRPPYFERGAHVFPLGGFLHLCSGQEAIPVGVAEVFRRGIDTYAGAFRCHGWALALGMSPRAAMAELYGKAAGCCRGRGGSMHLRDAETGNMGGWATVGGQMPVGAGAAFAAQYRDTGGVAFVAFGDGTLGQGVYAETLNLAALLRLPTVFILEDNGIALGTKVPRHSAEPDLARRGEGFGMAVRSLDGNDVDEVVRVVAEAADRARAGGGPTFLVARTFRLRGYSMSDPMKYRTKDEMADAKARDPTTTYATRLLASGAMGDPSLERLREETEHVVDDAVAFAESAPHPGEAERFDHLLSDVYPFAPAPFPVTAPSATLGGTTETPPDSPAGTPPASPPRPRGS